MSAPAEPTGVSSKASRLVLDGAGRPVARHRQKSGGRQIGVRAYDEEDNSSGAQAALSG
jgi:hypothetical protein